MSLPQPDCSFGESGTLFFWTIYERPQDYPNHWVVRYWKVQAGVVAPGEVRALAKSLEEARGMLPMGLTNLGRRLGDDPVIVETWL